MSYNCVSQRRIRLIQTENKPSRRDSRTMPNYSHYGLYFNAQQVLQAQQKREREPLKTAWAFFDQPDTPIHDLLWDALHYRLNNQQQAGEAAAVVLQEGAGLKATQTRFEALTSAVMLAHAYELVRDHEAFSDEAQAAWRSRFAQRVDRLSGEMPTESDAETPHPEQFVEYIWLGLLHLVAGIVLEDDAHFEAGVDIYHDIIDHHVRPEGYLPHAVEGENGGSLERQLLAVNALVLMAEAAKQVGLNLWDYSSRGISVITAASYGIYYYYYPEQWRWDTVNEEQAKALYKIYGGFCEIVNIHTPLRDSKMMLDELRPLYNPICGGLTTLTHGLRLKKGLFG